MKTVVTYGEIMARLKAKHYLKFRQCLPGDLELTFAGAEANVAASIAYMGGDARFVTALPNHSVADACVGTLRNLGVDTSRILRTERGRMGIYYVEAGANQRPSSVIYDRDSSSVSLTDGEEYPWKEILGDACWLHVTGITPALSEIAAKTCISAVRTARSLGLTVSCDLNYRKKLWRWKDGVEPRRLAEETMTQILPHVDVLFANEEDAQQIFGIDGNAVDTDSGTLDLSQYPETAREIVRRFPSIRKVATTLRESVSATHNNWGGMLYDADADESCFAPTEEERYAPYSINFIVDRIGGGDSFAAAYIFASLDEELGAGDQDVLSFAVAASCLCHSIHGDFNYSRKDEILALMRGQRSGRIKR